MPGIVNCASLDAAAWEVFNIEAKAALADIHLWYTQIDHWNGCILQLQALLDASEQVKASRFYNQAHRQRYIIQHGLLKLLIPWYLSSPVYKPQFIYNINNKPYLNDGRCFFNLSHSGSEMLIAIGNAEMGVDIECVDVDFVFRDIVSAYFSPAEEAFIKNGSLPQRTFFTLWTRKEALLKAGGQGIDDNLPQTPSLDGNSMLPDRFGTANLETRSFDIADKCLGAITTVAGKTLRLWELQPGIMVDELLQASAV